MGAHPTPGQLSSFDNLAAASFEIDSSGLHFPAISHCVVMCLIGRKAGRQSHPQMGLGIVPNKEWQALSEMSGIFWAVLGSLEPGMIKAGVETERNLTVGRPSQGRFAKSQLLFSQSFYLWT